jgi:hypothetical protein
LIDENEKDVFTQREQTTRERKNPKKPKAKVVTNVITQDRAQRMVIPEASLQSQRKEKSSKQYDQCSRQKTSGP